MYRIEQTPDAFTNSYLPDGFRSGESVNSGEINFRPSYINGDKRRSMVTFRASTPTCTASYLVNAVRPARYKEAPVQVNTPRGCKTLALEITIRGLLNWFGSFPFYKSLAKLGAATKISSARKFLVSDRPGKFSILTYSVIKRLTFFSRSPNKVNEERPLDG